LSGKLVTEPEMKRSSKLSSEKMRDKIRPMELRQKENLIRRFHSSGGY
jgi:hypothetical protein